MDREEALNRLRKILDRGEKNPRLDHIEADGILCDLLKTLGYGDVVEMYSEVYKWFA